MRDIAVLCANAEQFRTWAESCGRLCSINKQRAEGDGWRAYRVDSIEAAHGRSFSEIALLQDWRSCVSRDELNDLMWALEEHMRDVSVHVT